MSYDDGNATRREEAKVWTTAGNATISGKFMVFQKTRVNAAHAKVDVAGTTAGNSATVIQVSGTTTTTLASFALSTSTAGVTTDVTGIAATLLPYDHVYVVNGTDATGRALVTIEMQQTPDAVRSAY